MIKNSDLKFVSPSEKYLSELAAYRKEFIDSGDSMDGTGPLKRFENISEYLSETEKFLKKETLPEGMVLATQFLCVRKSDNRLVGMIQIRHYFNDFLEKFGGHIGYSVRPSERRKGYASWMLHNIMPFCRTIGLEKILVACLVENEGSRKTILKNGGLYEKTVYCEEHNANLERYWIDVNQQDYFETENLLLRKARPEDMDLMYKNVWTDQGLAKYMLWKPVLNREEAEIRIQKTIEYQSKALSYFVCLKENNEPIGFAGMAEEEPGIYEDCGVCISAKYQRKGFGKETVNALTHIAFDLLGGKEFIYGCWKENNASKALAKSLGFEYSHTQEQTRNWDGCKYISDYFKKNSCTLQ